MNSQTNFQQKNPLSPKKFWKKMLGIIPRILLWCAPLAVFIVPVTLAVRRGIPLFSGLMILLMYVAIFFAVVILLYAWYIKVYIKRYYYDASDEFLSIQKGVFAPTEIHVQYKKIQDVYVDQDIFDRMFGIYDVHIASATATSGIEAHIDGVDATTAENLKNFLLQKITGTAPVIADKSIGETMQAEKPKVVTTSFSGSVSDKNYPVSIKWVYSSMISGIVGSIIVSAILPLVVIWLRSGSDIKGATLLVSVLPLFIKIFVGFYVFSFFYSILWRKTFKFDFMPDFIQVQSGVLSRSNANLPYRTIQNVTLNQGMIERIFGLSTVVIENATQRAVQGSAQSLSGGKIILPGQPLLKGQELVEVLNKIISSQVNAGQTGL